jgi:hypothetical protein
VLVVAVLLLRRLPAMLLICPMIPILRRRADTLFIGWFGPVGVATIYYASHVEQRLGAPFIWDVASLVICASVLVHGLTSTHLTRLYGRVTGQTERNAACKERARRAEESDQGEKAEDEAPARAPDAGALPAPPGAGRPDAPPREHREEKPHAPDHRQRDVPHPRPGRSGHSPHHDE